jgi:OsmC subfamily peroxiredoxin
MKKSASVVWQGSIKEGQGLISTQTGVLKDAPYGFKSRFEDGPGTNPEELLGAAHAACFSMALSLMLGQNGLTPERIETKAEISHGESARHRRRDVREDRRAGEGRLPGIEGAEGQDHDGRDARRLKRSLLHAPGVPTRRRANVGAASAAMCSDRLDPSARLRAHARSLAVGSENQGDASNPFAKMRSLQATPTLLTFAPAIVPLPFVTVQALPPGCAAIVTV